MTEKPPIAVEKIRSSAELEISASAFETAETAVAAEIDDIDGRDRTAGRSAGRSAARAELKNWFDVPTSYLTPSCRRSVRSTKTSLAWIEIVGVLMSSCLTKSRIDAIRCGCRR